MTQLGMFGDIATLLHYVSKMVFPVLIILGRSRFYLPLEPEHNVTWHGHAAGVYVTGCLRADGTGPEQGTIPQFIQENL